MGTKCARVSSVFCFSKEVQSRIFHFQVMIHIIELNVQLTIAAGKSLIMGSLSSILV
jgi:hypothetical protein